jgi:hypothetical protein
MSHRYGNRPLSGWTKAPNGQMPATGPAARPQRALNRITAPGHAAYAPYFGMLTQQPRSTAEAGLTTVMRRAGGLGTVRPGTAARRSERRDTGGVDIILETPRLVMRQFTKDDVDNLFDLNSDPEVMRYLTGGKPTPAR